jgi:cobalt/nickel transport system ATP-binding protein
LLDEPSAALDPPAKHQLARLLQSQSAAMLVATHDLDFARRFCTRFVLLDKARIAFDGTDVEQILQVWACAD